MDYALLFRSGIYLVVSVLRRLAGVLLIPLLIVSLTPSEYTRYGLLMSIFVLAIPVITLNLHLAPSRLIFDYETVRERSRLITTTLWSGVLASIVCLAGIVAVLQGTAWIDPITQGRWVLLGGICLIILCKIVIEHASVLARANGHAGAYAGIVGIQTVGLLGIYAVLTHVGVSGFIPLIVALVVSHLCSVVGGLFYVKGQVEKIAWDMTMLKDAASYSAPMAVHLAALWAVSSSGHWIGAGYMPLADLAPYVLVTQLVTAVGMFIRALFDARQPEIGEAFAKGNWQEGRQIIRFTMLLGIAASVAAYAVLFVLLYGVGLELPGGYNPTPVLLLLAGCCNLFDAYYLQGVQSLRAVKKTHSLATATVTSGIVAVGLNFYLVQVLQDTGLILATALGLALQSGLSNYLSRRHVNNLAALQMRWAEAEATTP